MSRIFDAVNKAQSSSNFAYLDRTQAGTDEREQSLAPSLFELTDFPVRPWKPDEDQLVFLDSADSWVGVEQFRRLRSRLYQLSAKSPLKRVLVSSAVPEEGKTYVSANLAMALAKQGEQKVLLIDADLRKPSLHGLLGTPSRPGFSELLAGSIELPQAVQAGPIQNLWFIPGGAPPENAAELLGSALLAEVMGQLASLFDWIVVDSSPVLPVSDAVALSRSCDGILMVARANSTPHGSIKEAVHEFRDARMLGLVLNRAQEQTRQSSYYYSRYAYGDGSSGGKAVATTSPAR